MYIIPKTGSGKSAIPLTIATLCRGVSIILVPLLGLGSDQVTKAILADKNIHAFHVDEHQDVGRRKDETLLKDLLRNATPQKMANTSTLLFLSRQALGETSPWPDIISGLADRGYISLLCIDKAHSIEQQSRSFHPDFFTAAKKLQDICNKMETKCPRIAMSATL